MINLDKFLKQGVEVMINGEVIEILQPSAKMTKEIGQLEEDITEGNYLDVKSKITHKLLNNNASGKEFTIEEVDNIPFKLQDLIIKEVTCMIYKVEAN